jgi:PadR family transcriptional regulator, regulatory protein PadR
MFHTIHHQKLHRPSLQLRQPQSNPSPPSVSSLLLRVLCDSLSPPADQRHLSESKKHVDIPPRYYYYVVHMNHERSLGEFEQIVLLTILRLDDNAYGVTILNEIAAKTGRNPSPGALYTTLHRMESKGLVTSRDGSPTPERGGRAKRFVTVTREGRTALASAQTAYRSLLEGLDLLTTRTTLSLPRPHLIGIPQLSRLRPGFIQILPGALHA